MSAPACLRFPPAPLRLVGAPHPPSPHRVRLYLPSASPHPPVRHSSPVCHSPKVDATSLSTERLSPDGNLAIAISLQLHVSFLASLLFARGPVYSLHRVAVPSIGGLPCLKGRLSSWLLLTTRLPSPAASFTNGHMYVLLMRGERFAAQSTQVPRSWADHWRLLSEYLYSGSLCPHFPSCFLPAHLIMCPTQPSSTPPRVATQPTSYPRPSLDAHQSPPPPRRSRRS